MCESETDPQIYAREVYRPSWQPLTDATQMLIASARETLATNKALSAKLDLALRDTEILNRIRSVLRAGGESAAAPDLVVGEIIERDKDLREGANIWRKILDGMGFDKGSIPERLKAVEAALALKSSKLTAPLIVPTVPEGYYDLDLHHGEECTLTKEQSCHNAWVRTVSRACRILDYYGIPRNVTLADGTRKVLFIDERFELAMQQQNRQPAPVSEKKIA